jgi:hypothetical protein
LQKPRVKISIDKYFFFNDLKVPLSKAFQFSLVLLLLEAVLLKELLNPFAQLSSVPKPLIDVLFGKFEPNASS